MRIAFIDNEALFTIGRDGRGKRRVAYVGSEGRAASWSADGRLLVYERERLAGTLETDIWRVNADGTGAKPITRAFPTGESFSSPDCAAKTIPPRASRPAPTISLRPAHVLRTPAPIVDLSADGSRAAVVSGDVLCGPIAIWSPRGSASWIPGSSECGDGSMEEFVLAGTRVAWTVETDTNNLDYTDLETGTPGRQALRVTSTDHNEGDYLGNLAGDGPLLVYNTWRGGFRWEGGRVAPRLWRVVGERAAGARLVLAGPDALDVVAVGAGRIAVLRPDGRLVLLDSKGKRLSAFRLGRQGVEAVTLTGSILVVLRGKTVEVRDATTGTVKHCWPAASSSGAIELEDAHGNFAVYVAGIAIHLLRLSDGRDLVLAIAKQAGPAHAELEPERLYYSYNETGSAKPGRVAFVPYRELTARFR
jgi:hypothetical protein